jgi:hypothetical protein
MKKGRNISLTLKMLLIASFCSVIYLHSYSEIKHGYPELLSPTNSIENMLITDTDSSDEVPMLASLLSMITIQPESQKSELFLLPHINNIFDRVWQPPKVF